MKAQTIQIDSIFSADGEISPFQGINVLSELSAGGEVSLHADTSLVRIILVDEEDIHYLVFEAYPLICDSLDFSFDDYCDETCSLDEVEPYSLIIQIVNAELFLKDLSFSSTPKSNPETLRYEAKRDKDQKKIESLNLNIPAYGMNWTAGDNSIVAYYYEEKRQLFGDGYNLLGYDYYAGGVFEFLGHGIYPKVDPDLVRHFDWRERHGANDSLSPYYDGDTLGTGWFTSIKNQGGCGSCWTFAPIGAIEAIINLNTTYHLDFDLSEQQVLSCAYAAGGCSGGNVDSAYYFIKDEGIVTENCCGYLEQSPYCWQLNVCEEPDTVVTLKDIYGVKYNQDSIRISLINNGPQAASFNYPGVGNHAVVITGFAFNHEDSTLTWIFKNSWGTTRKPGFEAMKISSLINHVIDPTVFINNVAFKDTCRNEDGDEYYFWGLGPKPTGCNCSDIEDCDDNDPLVGGYDENYNCRCLLELDTLVHHISADTTWADSMLVDYHISIDSGACLTISSYIAFAPNARLMVNRGGKLIVDGGCLTKACPELWSGIEVFGRDTSQFFEKYFGVVQLQNEAVISNAKIGIANYCSVGDPYLEYNGGIIEAGFSTFLNNEIDVKLAAFVNAWQGNEIPYSARFEKCTFVTTDEFYPEHVPLAHVDLKDVYGVMFYGCVFKNDSGYEYLPYPVRGTGIASIDATFMLQHYCNDTNTYPCAHADTCEFQNLEYGVRAMNAESVRSLRLNENKFYHNLVGISLSGIDYAEVLSNKFENPNIITNVVSNRFNGSLFMEGCNGYHVEDNYFFADFHQMSSGYSLWYGIGVKNSGPENNEIYNNYFERLNAGIIAIGENRGERDPSGLCLKCNDMMKNNNDFLVVDDDGPPTGIQGIRPYQGNPNDTISVTAPAGNTFTDQGTQPANYNSLTRFNYYNSAEDIWYMHHASGAGIVRPLENNYTDETIELVSINIQYNKFDACPSSLGGGSQLKSYNNPRQNILDADNQISSLKYQLNELIDGGNTEVLNFEVMTSFPDEGLELSQELLGDSPYLSDTVIKQAIYKEDVLPNAMIRDIMAANPQSAKKDELLEALDSRFEPMPEYMMAQIMEGREYFGAKELLEAEIQSWMQLRSKAKNELMRQFLLDSSIIHPIDSVIAFLETENDLDSKYSLALAYWNKEEFINTWQTLTNIPYQFTLDDNLIATHQQYYEYFNILQQLADSNWRTCDLDSTSVESLFSLMEDGNADISAYARGLLVKGAFMNYLETMYIPSITKSGPIVYHSNEEFPEQRKSDNLKLFPNPAGDYVIAYYNVNSDDLSALLTLHDVRGNILSEYRLDAEENQVVLKLSNLPNGVYIISLKVKGQIVRTEKLSKGRY